MATMNRRTLARSLIVLGFVLGFACMPALGANLPFSSSSLTTFHTCTLMGTTAISTVTADTYVDQSKATTNFGNATTLTVRSQSTKNTRAYVSFDLTRCSPAIPSTATINSAGL